jgi:hypothetical protein
MTKEKAAPREAARSVEFRKCPPRIAAGQAVDKAGQAAMIEAANRHGRERLVLASCRLRTRAAGAWPELAECRLRVPPPRCYVASGMTHSRWHRIRTLLLAAIILLWPVVPPPVMNARAAETRVSTTPPQGCPGCERGMVRGSCAVTSCAALPALLPAAFPPLAVPGGTAFASVDERGHGRSPGVQTPPPRPLPHT